jgi:hypothetical protein
LRRLDGGGWPRRRESRGWLPGTGRLTCTQNAYTRQDKRAYRRNALSRVPRTCRIHH